ncbi:MAG: DUF3306 domain-containing protein [Hydrogenophaga sp.]|uniref:DUF3306 domain-containing protein n=1 Tax=Hydrogenophaga sp. TaxID=1904254 RepID=UPI003D146147
MTTEDRHFFSRWSRRKEQARAGEPLPPEPTIESAAPVAPVAVAKAVVEAPPVAAPSEEPRAGQAPAPTLEDVARLTPESDFSSFVARGVPSDVRNAAVKKLFTDPRYNVMDGLDIYIDDYSKPSPLSVADMARMVGAQFLKLVDDPEDKPKVVVRQESEKTSETQPDQPAAENAAEPRETIASDSEFPKTHDDHADLQLQPDDALEPRGSGAGTG